MEERLVHEENVLVDKEERTFLEVQKEPREEGSEGFAESVKMVKEDFGVSLLPCCVTNDLDLKNEEIGVEVFSGMESLCLNRKGVSVLEFLWGSCCFDLEPVTVLGTAKWVLGSDIVEGLRITIELFDILTRDANFFAEYDIVWLGSAKWVLCSEVVEGLLIMIELLDMDGTRRDAIFFAEKDIADSLIIFSVSKLLATLILFPNVTWHPGECVLSGSSCT